MKGWERREGWEASVMMVTSSKRVVSFFSDDDVVYIVGSSDAGYRMPVLGE